MEIEEVGLNLNRVISVDTFERWRLLYNPVNDQIWIDDMDAKTLTKYRGFTEVGKYIIEKAKAPSYRQALFESGS